MNEERVKMTKDIAKRINQDFQIKKFSAYGFLKNLQFFEPYLVIYLMGIGLNLFQIGFLYSIREIVTYIFEIPSGIIADYHGRKKELYMCFSFYILSFIIFFFADRFAIAAIAMFCFGLGEAFRSGTHKAMIYTYLEKQGLYAYKAYVYGRTRSYSLKGSALSAVLSIIIILNVPSSRYIFLVTTIPYILDFINVATYPAYLDVSGKKKEGTLSHSIVHHVTDIFTSKVLREILLTTGFFQAVYKSTKDLIQPILEGLILSSGVVVIAKFSGDDNVKIILGLSYAIIYIISSDAAKNTYRLKKYWSGVKILDLGFMAMAIIMIMIAVAIQMNVYILIIMAFLLMHVVVDLRKPIYIDVVDDYMEKDKRATVLSIESQITALSVVIMAPLIGFVADHFGIQTVMILLSAVLLIIILFFSTSKYTKSRQKQ